MYIYSKLFLHFVNAYVSTLFGSKRNYMAIFNTSKLSFAIKIFRRYAMFKHLEIFYVFVTCNVLTLFVDYQMLMNKLWKEYLLPGMDEDASMVLMGSALPV